MTMGAGLSLWERYWSLPVFEINLLLFANLCGALLLGLLVGVGFYPAAILLALLSASLMMWGVKVEARLPALPATGVMLGFVPGHEPDDLAIKAAMRDWGYVLAEGSLHNACQHGQVSRQFVLVARPARCRQPEADARAQLRPGIWAVQATSGGCCIASTCCHSMAACSCQ